jgi:hypothetical protein
MRPSTNALEAEMIPMSFNDFDAQANLTWEAAAQHPFLTTQSAQMNQLSSPFWSCVDEPIDNKIHQRSSKPDDLQQNYQNCSSYSSSSSCAQLSPRAESNASREDIVSQEAFLRKWVSHPGSHLWLDSGTTDVPASLKETTRTKSPCATFLSRPETKTTARVDSRARVLQVKV